MYSDIQIQDENAANLEQRLRRAAAAAAAAAGGGGANTPGVFIPLQSLQRAQNQASSGNPRTALSGPRPAAQSNQDPSLAQSGTNPIFNNGTGPSSIERFLILCVNGPFFIRYEHIPLENNVDDKVLFQRIRSAYTNLRQERILNVHPDTPEIIKNITEWKQAALSALQKYIINLCEKLRLGWLFWWMGDDIFFLPKSAAFVKVGHASLCL